MNKIQETVKNLLQLDISNNICYIGLQSDAVNAVEINVVFYNYNTISEDMWKYTLSHSTPEFQIDNFGIDQELPPVKEYLFKRG